MRDESQTRVFRALVKLLVICYSGEMLCCDHKLTLLKALPTVFSRSRGVLSSNTCEDSWSNGRTLRNIKTAINNEHTGSAMNKPNCSMSTDDTMTPTLPKVSATTCRKTPATNNTNINVRETLVCSSDRSGRFVQSYMTYLLLRMYAID